MRANTARRYHSTALGVLHSSTINKVNPRHGMVQLATRNVLHNRRSPQNLHVATPIAHLVTQPYAPPEVTPEVAFQSITSGCSLQVLNTASDWVANSRFLCCASSVVRRCEVNRTATCTHHGWYIQTLPSAPPRTSRCSQCYFRLQFTAADTAID